MAKMVEKDTDEEINMTPMIDVVFQLIIFFMLVTEMSQADLEQMELPEASMASPDDSPEKDRMVLNVTEDGKVKIRGRDYTDPKRLKPWLQLEADKGRKPDDPLHLCDRALLIRADKNAEYKYIQYLMQECVQPKVRIWKIFIAAKEVEK